MASSAEFKDYILEQTRNLPNILCKPMMGEFLLYYNGILFGGIYDNRFLIKKTKSNESFSLKEEIPYENAKTMYMIENLEDTEYFSEIITITCNDLKNKNG